MSENIFLFSQNSRKGRTPREDRSGKYREPQDGTDLRLQPIRQTNGHRRRNRLRSSLSCYHRDSVSVSGLSLCYHTDSALLSEVFV